MKQHILVTATNTIEESFAAAMGINKEREQQIDDLMDKCHGETQTYPDAIAAATKGLDNANELAYVAFHLGAFAENQRSKKDLLSQLLGEGN